MLKGLVFDIRRFAIHDGPGIRTTVFLKGCPLRCPWCQNPEGLSLTKNLVYFPNKCIACKTCISACPNKALSWRAGGVFIDRKLCKSCASCVDFCPANALNFDAREMSVAEVVEEVLKDKAFYRDEGGLSLSGGEPSYQTEFCEAILSACQNLGIHTAMETSLYMSEEKFERILTKLDYLIADIKIFDAAKHLEHIKVDNILIKKNMQRVLLAEKPELLIRIPMIPAYTVDDENLVAIAHFLSGLAKHPKRKKSLAVEILNYNPLARNKYKNLDMDYSLEHSKPFSATELKHFIHILREGGVDAFYSD